MAEHNFRLTLQHPLDDATALERIQQLLARVKEQFKDHVQGLHEKWDGNSCTFRLTFHDMGFSGKMTVSDGAIRIVGTLPFFALLFKERIQHEITEQARQLLAA